MQGYNTWPSGFTKGTDAFAGGVYDGVHIWMVPWSASHVLRVKASDGSMQGYNAWPSGFTKGTVAFAGGVYDGVHIWMVPYNADRIIQIRSQQPRAPPTPAPPFGGRVKSLNFDYFKIQLFFISFFFFFRCISSVCFAAWPLFEIGTCLFKALLLVFLGIVVTCFPHVLCINLCHSATVVPFPVPLGHRAMLSFVNCTV